ncbi:hypothetical protein K488DRAFT_74746 [Vararia minispora EC-137]|uniref:Uncharacterized protein n=1 Tax=Vararia minispora EC-137 TaxID=1314806 RepID=A0ACB8Q621_9AGAM|nr:hypothetical protein K488DRAFT_74746 [Vararia minispora EC-137]
MYNFNLRPAIIIRLSILSSHTAYDVLNDAQSHSSSASGPSPPPAPDASQVSSFRGINDDKHDGFSRLATFAGILGALYISAAIGEFVGTFAAFSQSLSLIRLFWLVHLSAVLFLVAAAFMRVILHFHLKSDLLNDCVQAATGTTVDFSWGLWGPRLTETLSQADAQAWCNNAYSHESWYEIVLLIVTIIILGLFSTTVYTYTHRTVPGFSRSGPPPAGQNPYYQPPFAASVPAYAPPAGPPPHMLRTSDSTDELPAYGFAGDGKDVKDVKDGKGGGDVEAGGAKGAVDDDPFADFEVRK